MKNGAVALKFKIDYKNPNQFKHTPASVAARDPGAEIQKPDGLPLELSTTHHDSNCVRCYKLKKKCSRTYPSCDYCRRLKTPCEYVDRRKRRLHFEDSGEAKEGEVTTTSQGVTDSRPPILIASLVNHDQTGASASADAHAPTDAHADAEEFRNIDPDASNRASTGGPSGVGSSRTHSRMAVTASAAMSRRKPAASVSRNIVSMSVVDRNADTLQSELLAVRPIADVSLPSAFVHTFFANYEWKYPFLARHEFSKKLDGLLFQNETLVGLDVYLVMAIGCIIYDTNFGTQHYADVFSDSFVELIVDMISYDIKSEEDLHKAHLLILLSIYAVNVGNVNLLWNIVGFLNRLIVFLTDFSGKTNACMRKRCFWTVFNLDKELSLVLDKPSQFVPTRIIKLSSDFADTLHTGELERSAAFMSLSVTLHMLQDCMISYRLGLAPVQKEALNQFSADMERWRVGLQLLLHTEYAELSLLQNFTGLMHLDYYYLQIELDQLSSTESSQFTLQFLSTSFSLLLSEVSDKKDSGGTSIYSLFWFLKFFKVVEYSIDSLLRLLRTCDNKRDLMMRLNDFNTNVQLEINLLKFLLNSKSKPPRFTPRLESYLVKLKTLSQKLVSFNPFAGEEKDVEKLTQEITEMFKAE